MEVATWSSYIVPSRAPSCSSAYVTIARMQALSTPILTALLHHHKKISGILFRSQSKQSWPPMFTLTGIHWSFVESTVRERKLHGCGAYGRVFEVDYKGTLCAAKEVQALLLQSAQGGDLQKIKDDFLSECQIWSMLRKGSDTWSFHQHDSESTWNSTWFQDS